MKHFVKLLILFLLLLFLPVAVFTAAVHTKENPYHNSFTASLVDKYERLNTVPGARLVLIGGSSLPFGIRSAQLEEAIGLPVVNFGVYAALGTKVMTEIALPQLHSGDVVILAPELDPQTYSDYFNPDILWEACCENTALLKGLDLSEKEEMAFRWFKFALQKKELEGETVPKGVLYARSSFNPYGDIDFPRPENIMAGGFDASQPVRLSPLQKEEFFGFIRTFSRTCEKKGVRVFFSFSPINRAAIRYSAEESENFEAFLSGQLPGQLLGKLSDMTYDASYFYNTNYHLNEAGAVLHTRTLARLLSEALNIPAGTPPFTELAEVPGDTTTADEAIPSVSESSPSPSSAADASSEAPVLPYDPNERFVTIREIGGNLYVIGLSEEGRRQISLTLPENWEGRPVIGISEGAMASSVLQELIIPANYRVFDSCIFEESPSLARILLYLSEPSASAIPMSGLFEGCAKELQVYVPDESYAAYLSDYNWRLYSGYLHTISECILP